jgi:hypothetical protein
MMDGTAKNILAVRFVKNSLLPVMIGACGGVYSNS